VPGCAVAAGLAIDIAEKKQVLIGPAGKKTALAVLCVRSERAVDKNDRPAHYANG